MSGIIERTPLKVRASCGKQVSMPQGRDFGHTRPAVFFCLQYAQPIGFLSRATSSAPTRTTVRHFVFFSTKINKSTNQQINKSTNRQIDKSTNRQINKSTNQQIDKSTNRQINKSTNQQINKSNLGTDLDRPDPKSRIFFL
jgi:hypothetical protein